MEIIDKLLEEKIVFPVLFLIGGMLLFIIGLSILFLTCQIPTEITIGIGIPTEFVCDSYGLAIGGAFLFSAFLIPFFLSIAWVASKLFIILEKRKSKLSKKSKE